MAKYVVLGGAAIASAYYGYKYFEICKKNLQEFVNNALKTIEETHMALIEIQRRLERLENCYDKSGDETDLSRSFLNGESFSFVSVRDEVTSSAQDVGHEEPPKSTDPYIADVQNVIKNVRKEAAELEERVRYYKGTAGDRVYKQFNEKIIRLLITLDRVDVKGNDILKEERKDAVDYLKSIQAFLKTR